MSAEGKPTVQEIVASANESLDDAILAALDTFGPATCQGKLMYGSEACPNLVADRVTLMCCHLVTSMCSFHSNLVMEFVLRRPGRARCARCDTQMRSFLISIAPIGGAK
jgi:hypothetical protein